MALILGDVYRETKQQFQLRLVAGETGLGNVLKWVSVVEDASTFGFLRGGELLLTTGVVLCNQPGGLIHFLRRAVSRGTCGMIVNIGKYIGTENITQEVIDFCEEQQYPLFLLPWHIPFYDFTWEYYNRIFLDSRRNEE
ncbi:MAG: PucR family transcriptional regulator ligand-binding domain-containing protein, partial [Clostridiales bacterium]|nr:PucR family transcriptional regulator ligand-binding domain-containing protein [Clostridiales bacterium]